VTNHLHNEVNGNIGIVTTNYLKHENGVGFFKQTMEFPVVTMKDLIEVYCTSDVAASQCKNMASFSTLHHKDDLLCMSWCTTSHCHMTGTCGGGAINPLKPELYPICYLLALLAHHFLHVSRIRVKSLTIRLLMSYIYGAPILDVSRSHTTTQHSR